MSFRRREAVIFDVDGTLVDSEGLTERAVAGLLRRRGLGAGDLDLRQFHGITWQETEALLVNRFPALKQGAPLAPELQRGFHRLLLERPPPAIPGAAQAVAQAASHLPTAVVSSSARASVEHVLRVHEMLGLIRVSVCAEDCRRSKPDPEGYLEAARRLGCAPRACLVFEDSVAGLTAARAAGMATIAITRGEPDRVRALADRTIRDYEELPADFFGRIRR